MANRRRKYLIDPRCQWIYIFHILVLEILVAIPCVLLTAFVTLYMVSSDAEGAGYWMRVLGMVAVLCLIASAFLVYLGVRISNRIFGPIYRFQMVFHQAAETGHAPHDIRLRPDDEFKDLADTMNRYFARLRGET
jgi:methyl-accepting chemotaxis protein